MKYCLPLVMLFVAACNNSGKKHAAPSSPKKDSLTRATGETVIAERESMWLAMNRKSHNPI